MISFNNIVSLIWDHDMELLPGDLSNAKLLLKAVTEVLWVINGVTPPLTSPVRVG